MNRKLFYIIILIAIMSSCKSRNSALISYWENGNVRSELHKVNDTLNGYCKWYYATGTPMMDANYKMGVLNGESTRWYENGQVMIKATYLENQYEGVVEEYNVAGVLVKKSTYMVGVLNGMFYQWYDDGKQYVEGEYLNGMMHGSWIMYYPDGSIGSKADYDRGTGTQYGYSEGGLYKNAMIHYKDNLKDGREYRYAIDGSVEEILIWSKGEYLGNVLIDK